MSTGKITGQRGEPLTVYFDKHKNPYRFVRLHYKNRRRGIMLHKLLWMVANNRIVPKGCEVHHKFSKDRNLPCDCELLTQEDHWEVSREWYEGATWRNGEKIA